LLFDSKKLRDSTLVMSVLRKYLVKVPQNVVLVFEVTAESPLAAKNLVVSGDVKEVWQEAGRFEEKNVSTDSWGVEEIID